MELMEELKFCSKTQTLQTEEAWQEDMYQTLIKCRRYMCDRICEMYSNNSIVLVLLRPGL